MPSIFTQGGGAGIGSYVIVFENGQLAAGTRLLKLRGAYEAGEQIYFSIIDDDTKDALIPASGWIDDEDHLHLTARDFDDEKTYKIDMSYAPIESEIEIDVTVDDGVELGEDEIVSKEEVNAELALKADLVDGKVPADQLPSYVDDVVEYESASAFPEEGDAGKIYLAIDTGNTYRWSGSEYVQIGGQDLSNYYNKTETDNLLNGKQATLVSSTNIKTINNVSILGEGNLDVSDSRIPAATSADNGKVIKVDAQGDYVLGAESGGMSNPMTTAGDIIVGGASGAPARVAVGTVGQVLTVGTNNIVGWANAASGGVTEQRVQEMIDAAIGNALNASY